MNKSVFLLLVLAAVAINATAYAGEARLPKHKREKAVEAAAPPVGQEATMQIATQSAMASMSSDQMLELAACLEKNVDPETVNSLVGQGLPGSGSQNMQEYIKTPQGQTVIANCQRQIQALLPQVQKKFQEDMSQAPQLPTPLPK